MENSQIDFVERDAKYKRLTAYLLGFTIMYGLAYEINVMMKAFPVSG